MLASAFLLLCQPGGDVEEIRGHGLHLATGKTTDGRLCGVQCGEAALVHEMTGQGGLAATMPVEVIVQLGEPDIVVGGQGDGFHGKEEGGRMKDEGRNIKRDW